MAKITVTRTFSAAPDAVWKLIGDPGALAAWHPEIEISSLHGNRLTSVSKNSMTVIEEVIARTPNSFTYTLVEAPVPVSSYTATLRVDAADEGCRVTWEATLEVKPGAPADQIESFVRAMFETGLAAIPAALT